MRKNTKATLAVAAALLSSVATHAFAEDQKKPGTGPNPYRDCGIGGAMFQDTAWAAVTSNIIWDAGTTAVTSATMSPETCNGKNVVAAEFILNTYDNLIEEAAQGEGEHLTTVMNIYSCSAEQQPAIASDIREKAAASVTSAGFAELSDVEKASRLFENIETTVTTEHSAHCAV